MLRHPLREGGAPDVLFQAAALDEVAAVLATRSMLVATGAAAGPATLIAGASTGVTTYDPAAHGMLEVLNQTSRYEPPAVPPFVLRPEVIPVANPIVTVHLEIEDFLAEHVSAPAD